MKISLIVSVPGPVQGKTIPVTRWPFLIGRDGKCHLRPSSAVVSNRHCAIDVRGDQAFVVDLKSTNGTFLNGQRMAKEIEVHDGDRVQVGPLVFTVRIDRGVAINQPTPLPPSRTPAPAPLAEDDAVAAVLLSMSDGDGPATMAGPVDATGVPTGGTEVLKTQDIPGPAEAGANAHKPGEKKDKAKAAAQNTSTVADELLKKYLRRPRKV